MSYILLENKKGEFSEVRMRPSRERATHRHKLSLCFFMAVVSASPLLTTAESVTGQAPSTEQQLFDTESVYVAKVEFAGNTVFSQGQLAALVEPLIGKRLVVSDLLRLKSRVTDHYRKKGYITSEAIIPDQQVRRGLLKVKINEGILSSVVLFDAGDLYLRPNYIRERIAIKPEPLNINSLKERIEMLHLDERIDSVKAALLPGNIPQERELGLEIQEAPRHSAGISVANSRSPSVGEFEAGFWYRNINLTGFGDELSLGVGASEGVESVSVFYRHPISANNGTLSLSHQVTDSLIIEEPFDELNIESKTKITSVAYESPLHQSPSGYLKARIQLDRKSNLSTISGGPLNFSLEDEGGKLKIKVARIGLTYLKKSNRQVFLFGTELSLGIDGPDLQSADSEDNLVSPNPNFKKLNLQLHYLYRPNHVRYSARLVAQHAWDMLFSMEKFGIGGVSTLRGYRENLYVRDQGVSVQLDATRPVYGERLSLTLFSDAGYAAEFGTPSNHRFASSIGFGLQWEPSKKALLELLWGHELQTVIHNDDNNLQDQGLHFRLDLRAI